MRHFLDQVKNVDFKFVEVERHVDVADLITVDMPDLIHGRLGNLFSLTFIFERTIDDPDILPIEDLGPFNVDLFVYCKQ